MKRLLVFQHVPYEVLGKLDPMLRSAGFRIRYVNFGRDPDTLPDEQWQTDIFLSAQNK